jgi:hypothetical protein
VEGIMEGKEWVWDNGIIKEMDIESYKRQLEVKYAKRSAQVEKRVEVFEDFMSKI